ncbi:MAG: hypothetical protein M1837_002924 [Sclerophora amabilis]|nr:MAG: hypothetical protein M1837_002924 [Sclerophora amabilis]
MHVGIVGGGISGLYSAILLRRQGHQVTVYEANDRLGGRIYTHHFPSRSRHQESFFEAGAMRIPRSSLHASFYELIRYLNTNGAPEDKIELIPYILEDENNFSFLYGQKVASGEKNLAARLGLPPEYQGRSSKELLGEVVRPWLNMLRQDFDAGFQRVLQYDEFSFRAYLRVVARWPDEVIEFVELMNSQTNQYDLSFTEIILQNLDFETAKWVTVRNGMSRVIQSAAKLVGHHNIRRNSPVVRITNLPGGRILLATSGPIPSSAEYEKVILAIPPAALHQILERPAWSFMKEQSIRGMHYEPLYKIGLHFRTRFWERSLRPSFGGQSMTDLRFRWIVYPSNDIGSDGPGVLLLYCWMTDALRLSSIPREERISMALYDLNKFFKGDGEGVNVYEQFIEAFDVAWSQESCTGDAQFLPGQFSRFHQVSKLREGNIHFAGEHLSRHHTWITGAIDSALSTVRDMLGLKELPALGRESKYPSKMLEG